MPPKVKLYKTTGKSQLKTTQNSAPGSSVVMTPEQEEQFQVELYWCIQQLKTALNSGKLNNKQVQDNTKALNTLMNNSTSVVQKRQVMRLSFGNYREKIAAAEEKASKNITNMQLRPVKPDKKSLFVKKSVSLTSGKHNFRFNFDIPPEDTVETYESRTEDKSVSNVINDKPEHNKCCYLPSSNNFRFNFSVDEPEMQ